MKSRQQLFFRADEKDIAVTEAKKMNKPLFAIVDKRTRSWRPKMYVIGLGAVERMKQAGMFKRMWIWERLESNGLPT